MVGFENCWDHKNRTVKNSQEPQKNLFLKTKMKTNKGEKKCHRITYFYFKKSLWFIYTYYVIYIALKSDSLVSISVLHLSLM